MRALSRRIPPLLLATLAVTAIWLLWDNRPALPSITRSVTVGNAEGLFGFVAWLGLLVLAVGLLDRIARHSRSRPLPLAAQHLHRPRSQTCNRSPRTSDGYPATAFPIIPQARLEPLPERPEVAEPAEDSSSRTIDTSQDPASRALPLAASISMLGPLTITGPCQRGRRLRGATRELLCYLALHPAGVHRDQITDALWPNESPEKGRNRLWRSVADARTHLGETILIREADRYQLNRTEIRIDVDRLEQLLSELSHTDNSGLQLPLLEQALALYCGEPLAGSDYLWAEPDQRRLHATQLDLLERTGRARLATGDPAGALANAEQGLATEPYNEQLARLAMQAEAALDLRSAVIARYERLRLLLDQQLGLQPNQGTRRLYRQLLGQDQTSLHPSRRDCERDSISAQPQ